MPLDLVVPDLLPPADATAEMRAIRLPALERWIARGTTRQAPQRSAEAFLADAFGLASPWPVAAISLVADVAPKEGTWLRADPVHMRVGQDSVSLHDAAMLDIREEEAAALLSSLQALVRDDGIELTAPRPERWYARIPADELPATTPAREVWGRNVFRLLPSRPGRINWGSLITEAQMLFTTHEVNRKREADGLPAINGIWFWGGGALPARVERRYDHVYGDDPFASGLGMLSGARSSGVPDGPDRLATDGSALLVLSAAEEALRSGDSGAWSDAARRLDEKWFAHLPRLVERHDEVRLILPAASHTVITTLDSRARWRWLRRPRPLASHA